MQQAGIRHGWARLGLPPEGEQAWLVGVLGFRVAGGIERLTRSEAAKVLDAIKREQARDRASDDAV
jgi:hypothetical protein